MARAETKGIGRACVRRAVNHHAPLATKLKKWEAALSWINRGIDDHRPSMSVLRNLAIDCRPPPSSLRSPGAADIIIGRPDRPSSIVRPEPEPLKRKSPTAATSTSPSPPRRLEPVERVARHRAAPPRARVTNPNASPPLRKQILPHDLLDQIANLLGMVHSFFDTLTVAYDGWRYVRGVSEGVERRCAESFHGFITTHPILPALAAASIAAGRSAREKLWG